MTTIAQGASAVITVAEGETVLLSSGKTDIARLEVTTGSNAGRIITNSHSGRRRYGPFTAGTLTLGAITGYCTYWVSNEGVNDIEEPAEFVTVGSTDLLGLYTAGRGVPLGVFLKDPTTGLIYGQSDGAGGFSSLGSGGGAGGWGSDRTAGVFETSEITGDYLVTTETIDGIPWTIGRDSQDREILRQWTAAGLSRTIDYSGGGGVASGNFLVNGGEIWVTDSQMSTIKTALAGLGSSMLGAPRFFVQDFNSNRGVTVEWNRVDGCFRGPGGSPINLAIFPTEIVTQTGTTSESSALYTATSPGWLAGPRGRWKWSVDFKKTGTANTWSAYVKAGGTTIISYNAAGATNVTFRLQGVIKNRNATNLNRYSGAIGDNDGLTTAALTDSSLNTAAAGGFNFTATVQLVSGTADTCGVSQAYLEYNHD